MFAILTLLFVLSLSLLTTKIGSEALAMTGLASEAARFQARSAFTGVGFTTSESESVVSHPARRRILMNLMLAGNVGLVTAGSSLMVSFVSADSQSETLACTGVLAAGLVVLWLVARSALFERLLSRWIGAWLRRFTTLDDFAQLQRLQLSDDYDVVELRLDKTSRLVGLALGEVSKDGLEVLGVRGVSGDYQHSPRDDSLMRTGDSLVLYGHRQAVNELAARN